MTNSTNAGFKGSAQSMYRLRDLKNGLFQFHVKDGQAFEGNAKAIIKKCVRDLGFEFKELEDAVVDLNVLGHDYAEFGVFKKYMYTQKDVKAA